MLVEPATPADAEALLPLMRAYCEFYEVSPPDAGLLEMARALAVAGDSEGMLLVARDGGTAPIGFAACGWKWSSLRAARVTVLEDLFVALDARGRGVGRALIDACAERARANGAPCLQWVTALDNERAQALYEKMGATGEPWLEYELEL